METIQERRLKLLNETIAYFNQSNRCELALSGCQYSPTEKSEGCAVGRLIADKEVCKVLDSKLINADSKDVLEALPIEIQELGADFLRSLQILHDSSFNWTPIGLSYSGECVVSTIKKDFIE